MYATISLLRSRRALAATATLAVALAAILGGSALLAPTASAQAENPWLTNRFLNMAHQGGELEAPSNTMYALKSAIAERGADSLEIDVNASQDGDLIVIHDATVQGTTNGSGNVRDMTTAQIQQLDAAHWFAPGKAQYNHSLPESEYVLRGVRTGAVAPPPGYTADDFAHPTLKEVLDEFPDVPINIEIKGPNDDAERERIAELLAALLTAPPYAARNDIIVVSFNEGPLAHFHTLAPEVDLAASEDTLAPWALGLIQGEEVEPLPDGTVALQVPPLFDGLPVPQLLLSDAIDAHARGYAVHVWTDTADENPDSYRALVDAGVDGIMTQTPARLHEFLCAADVPRPDGSGRCQIALSLELKSQRLKRARKRGIRVTTACTGPCALELEGSVSRKQAKRAGIWPRRAKGKRLVIGESAVEPVDYESARSVIELRRRIARKLRKHRGNLRVRVVATADWAGSDPVTVRGSAKLEGKRKRRGR